MNEIEWGPAIRVNGIKPDWYAGEQFQWAPKGCDFDHFFSEGGMTFRAHEWNSLDWANVDRIRLPATHLVYIVIRYNDEHETNFAYWPGGKGMRGPNDYENGSVLLRDGRTEAYCPFAPFEDGGYEWHSAGWMNENSCSDIIGYTKRVVEETVTDDQPKEWVPKDGDWVRAIAPCPEIYGGPSNYDVGFETRIIADDNDGLCITDEQEFERLWSIHGENFVYIEGPEEDHSSQSLLRDLTEVLAERDRLRIENAELRAQLAKVKEILG